MFNRIFADLAAGGSKPDRLMIDAAHLKAHRTAAILSKRGEALLRFVGRTKGQLNSKLHAVTDGQGGPIVMRRTEGHARDFRGAALLLNALPPVRPPAS